MNLRSEIQWRRGDGAFGWLWDPRTGSVFGLNRSSAFVLERLAAGASAAELPALVAAELGAEPAAACDDVRAFLLQLEEHDLVEI